ncbi:AAA family ATPase [Prevotella aurantiaca]
MGNKTKNSQSNTISATETANFQLIAIKVNKDKTIGQRKLTANKPYFFSEGYEITNNVLTIKEENKISSNIYNLFLKDKEGQQPSISINAIVGENGSGKSTIVEYIIRLINNLSAAIFGERFSNPAAEHLHYIEGMDGELWYLVDNKAVRLVVNDKKVNLFSYTKNKKGKRFCNETLLLSNEKTDSLIPMKPLSLDKLKEFIPSLFYTLVSNYSIYAYNSIDYLDENNSIKLEKKIRGKVTNAKYECNWLSGIFHKNDGYQSPIVLTPYREEGNININTEKLLSKERLISLLLMDSKYYRTINGHLDVIGLKIIKNKKSKNRKTLKEEGLYHLTENGFKNIKKRIIELWIEKIGISKKEIENNNYKEEISTYIAYKTLKIASRYKQYSNIFYTKQHQRMYSRFDEGLLKKLIGKMCNDTSHITKKIRQCFLHLLYNPLGLKPEGETIIKIDEAEKRVKKGLTNSYSLRNNPFFKNISIDDLLPPPIFSIEIILKEKDKLNSDNVPFNTLSSGERQQAFSISSALYHLANIESVHNDENNERVCYSNALIIFEEVELYFHPQLQKQLIKNLLDGIKQMHFKHIKSIQIIFVTHSPFILSDIPTENILALKKNCTETKELKTFSANIYDILNTSFFMEEGAIGDYAQWIIQFIVKCFEDTQSIPPEDLLELISLIDEPLYHKVLMQRFYKKYPNQTPLSKKIEELEMQLDALKKQQNK